MLLGAFKTNQEIYTLPPPWLPISAHEVDRFLIVRPIRHNRPEILWRGEQQAVRNPEVPERAQVWEKALKN